MTEQQLYQLLASILVTGLSATSIKKGTDFAVWLYETITGKEMPGHAKAVIPVCIALLVPPAAYAILLVDSGLVHFDFGGMALVVFASFCGAWAWYQYSKYSTPAGSVVK